MSEPPVSPLSAPSTETQSLVSGVSRACHGPEVSTLMVREPASLETKTSLLTPFEPIAGSVSSSLHPPPSNRAEAAKAQIRLKRLV